MRALSIVRPGGQRIADGMKTIEVRRWQPELRPNEDLLIVQNERFLMNDGDEDLDGRVVAIVRVAAVRPFTRADMQAACATSFEEGWLSWELTAVRRLNSSLPVLAARRLYELDLPPDAITEAKTTYDGKAIAEEPPFGASVVVYRAGQTGPEFLVLHRANNGRDYEGDWAWTPPAGARWPGEVPEDCAKRELEEETGLRLPVKHTNGGTPDWFVYVAQAPTDAAVILDAEHDRFEWLTAPEAALRCQPERVAEQVRVVSRLLERAGR